MSQEKRKNWRDICEAVLREKDRDKVNALLEELLDSLDERARTPKRVILSAARRQPSGVQGPHKDVQRDEP